jgi:hypothetical protein
LPETLKHVKNHLLATAALIGFLFALPGAVVFSGAGPTTG